MIKLFSTKCKRSLLGIRRQLLCLAAYRTFLLHENVPLNLIHHRPWWLICFERLNEMFKYCIIRREMHLIYIWELFNTLKQQTGDLICTYIGVQFNALVFKVNSCNYFEQNVLHRYWFLYERRIDCTPIAAKGYNFLLFTIISKMIETNFVNNNKLMNLM